MEEAVFQKRLRWLGGENVKGFSVPQDIREEMNLEEGDMLKITIEKSDKGENM